MEILIKTDGSVGATELYMNGRRVLFAEFDIMVSQLKKGRGVKMQLTRRTDGSHLDFLSYYGGDFQKMDEMEKLTNGRNEEKAQPSTRDQE